MTRKMKVGMVGLGRMGGNMATRLRAGGHEVVGYDPSSADADVDSLEALTEALAGERARVVWVMVPAGDPTEDTIAALADLLAPGDLVIDGGNANWTDSVRRGERLAERQIGFVDAGVSGGVWGRENGYALMVGGGDEQVALAQPLFDVLKPADGGFAHVGGVGSGHFTKMVHNGIEYGLMQAYAEGYAILAKSGLGIDAQAAVESWRHGSVVRSWLLDLLCKAVADADFAHIRAVAADSGEGRWTVNEAVRLGVAAPVISAALFARFTSQDDDGVTMRVIAALRQQFGGHAVEMFE